jgi:hypothetical protein
VTDQTAARTSVVYDAIDAFQRTHRLPGLQHAQIRGLLAEHLARVLPLAAPAGVAPATDRAALDESETDEQRADREETKRDHARGDHTHCGITCEAELPTEHLRNFVIAKGYPGTKGALDELLRRARAAAALPATTDRAGEEHRVALSEALGLGTGAPWDAIHERATELGLPPLGRDPVARRLGLLAEYRATVYAEAMAALDAHLESFFRQHPEERQNSPWVLGWKDATAELRRVAAEAGPARQQPAAVQPSKEA